MTHSVLTLRPDLVALFPKAACRLCDVPFEELMKRIDTSLWLCLGLACFAAAPVSAQVSSPATEKLYLNVNVGGQLASRTLQNSASLPIYDETATLSATQPVSKGTVYDVGVGYRVWRDLYAGVVVSSFTTQGDATYTASVPDPLFFNRPKTTTGSATGLKHSEVGINPNVTWARTLTDKINLAIGLGASITKVKQELITGFSVKTGTPEVTVNPGEESGTAKGVYAAVDLIYNLKPMYGVGGFVRYSGGTVNLPSAPDLNVGGLQVGGGIRLRF